tara:strand:+ start:924 stop:1163 length:240 start_codon:yes stop_codon:yes gene_type:complete
MKIIQYTDGSAKMHFTIGEIKILKKKKFIEFPAEGMKSIADNLMHIAFNIHERLPGDKKNKVDIQNRPGQHIAATPDKK